jgi:ketosteroid isomerase-like protein
MSESPREVAQRLIRGITEERWAELPDLYAEDTVVELPFHPVSMSKVLRGRKEMAEHFAGAPARPLRLSARNIVVHETTDPEVVVIEYDYDGEVTTNGRTFTSPNIIVMRVRDGRIVSSRDYHDHRKILAALDG